MTVNQTQSADESIKTFTVKFSASLGDVPEIKEASGNADLKLTEVVKGKSSGEKIQLLIEDKPTPLFDIRDTESNVSS